MAVTGGRFPIWRGPLRAVLVIAWLPAVLTAMAGPSVAAASGPALGSSPRSLTWRSPVPGPLRVARPFQPPPSRYAAGHRGVDLTASAGTVVTAAGDGVVGFAGILAGRGVVTVVHGTLRTTYEPLDVEVVAGQRVRAGNRLGTMSGGHPSCGPARACLHWGLLRGEIYLDPLQLLHRNRSRLLPVWGVSPAVSQELGDGANTSGGEVAAGAHADRTTEAAALSATAADQGGWPPAPGAPAGGDATAGMRPVSERLAAPVLVAIFVVIVAARRVTAFASGIATSGRTWASAPGPRPTRRRSRGRARRPTPFGAAAPDGTSTIPAAPASTSDSCVTPRAARRVSPAAAGRLSCASDRSDSRSPPAPVRSPRA